eukprot:129267_1
MGAYLGAAQPTPSQTSFDTKTRITKYIWSIHPNNVQKFKNLPFKESIKSSTFKSENNLEWYLKCWPNGNAEHQRDSFGSGQGYCIVSLHLASMPTHYKSVRIYFSLHCPQTHSSLGFIAQSNLQISGCGWGWYEQLSSELISCDNISLVCSVRILEIEDTKHNMIYKYPLTVSNIYKEQQIHWQLHGSKLHKFHTAHVGKCMSSHSVSDTNPMFTFRCYPNGSPATALKKGYVDLILVLAALPIGVKSIKVKCKMQCVQIDHTETMTGWLRYTTRQITFKKYCLFNKLKLYSLLNFIGHIEILECVNEKEQTMIDIKYKNVLSPQSNDDSKHNELKDDIDHKLNEVDDSDATLLQKYNIRSGYGLILIVCIEDYQTLTKNKIKNLNGTVHDKKLMIDLFKNKYKYKIIQNQKNIVNYDAFTTLINDARHELYQHHQQYDFFGLIFSGHGNQHSIYTSDGRSYGRVDLYKFFNGLNCTRFKDKPKLLVLDACKGVFEAPQMKTAKCGSSSLNIGNNPTHPDDNIIILNANSDKYVGWDIKGKGGVLIQSLHHVLSNNTNKIRLDAMTKCIDMKMKEIGQETDTMQTLQKIEHGVKKEIYFCIEKKKIK